MKFIKKINRGLILTLIVVIAVASYLTVLHFSRKADREELKAYIEEYLPKEAQMYVLTEEKAAKYRDDGDKAYDNMVSDTEAQLSEFFTDNILCYESLADSIASTLKSQLDYESTEISMLNVGIKKISRINFSGNTAEVSVTVKLDYEGSSNLIGYSAADSIKNTSYEYDASFVFQKHNGEWKLYYSPGIQLMDPDAYYQYYSYTK